MDPYPRSPELQHRLASKLQINTAQQLQRMQPIGPEDTARTPPPYGLTVSAGHVYDASIIEVFQSSRSTLCAKGRPWHGRRMRTGYDELRGERDGRDARDLAAGVGSGSEWNQVRWGAVEQYPMRASVCRERAAAA